MCPDTQITPIQAYRNAVAAQRRAREEFETSEPARRARAKLNLADATGLVATAARSLNALLDPRLGDASHGSVRRARRRTRSAKAARLTTPAEEDLLRRLLEPDRLRYPNYPLGAFEPRNAAASRSDERTFSLGVADETRDDEAPEAPSDADL